MIQFDEHIFQVGWFNHQLVIPELINTNLEVQKGFFLSEHINWLTD